MDSKPNVVIVLLDTLRADHLSCYGHHRRSTPQIDALAEESTLYEMAVSAAPWTPPSHASLFTGTYPSRHGVDRSHLILDPTLVPIPQVLKANGYRTYGVSSNYWLSRETQFDRGFDEFVHSWQLVQTDGANAALRRQQRKQDLGIGVDGGNLGTRIGNRANEFFEKTTQRLRKRFHAYDDGAWRVNRTVKTWIDQWKRQDQPFFAFLHYMEPHIRYAAPGRFHRMHVDESVTDERIRRLNQDPWRYLVGQREMDGEDFEILSGLYDGEISYVDHKVGQVVEMMRSAGILDDTVLIITSDHGENLGDHQLMDHSYCLYRSLLRVPLIIRYPKGFAADRVSHHVQSPDIFPTILELAGVDDPTIWAQVQTRSLFTADDPSERIAISEYLEPQPPVRTLEQRYPGFDGAPYDRQLRAAQDATHKYVWGSDGRDELFDLTSDPLEERNIIDQQPEKAKALRLQLADWLESFQHSAQDQEGVELDQSTIKKLEQLGYL